MKIRIIGGDTWGLSVPPDTKGTSKPGAAHTGDVIDVPKDIADMLIRRGRGELVADSTAVEPEQKHDEAEAEFETQLETATAEPGSEDAMQPRVQRRKGV